MSNAYTTNDSLLGKPRSRPSAWIDRLLLFVPRIEAFEIVGLYFSMAPDYGINPDLALAQGCEETGFFTSVLWKTRRNPCGLGITGPGVLGVDYKTPARGIQAHLEHICAYAYPEDKCPVDHENMIDNRHTFHDGNPRITHLQEKPDGRRWAEKEGYVGRILVLANSVEQEQSTMPVVAISSGHLNVDSGDAFEKEQTGELTEAVARWLPKYGIDVIVLNPDGPDPDSDRGDGQYPGGIWDVAKAVVAMVKAGKSIDVLLETHTEGGGGTGVFAIHPDWGSDVDVDVKNTLGPNIAKRVAAATGLRVGGRRNGTMSEKETGVGSSGFRLGIFGQSAPIASSVTRLIVEYGAHDKEPDLTIVKKPGFYDKAGRATAEALAEFFGLSTTPIGSGSQVTPAGPEPIVARGFLRNGRAILEIDFGGDSDEILGFTVIDAGISIRKGQAKYDRSLINNDGSRDWTKRP